MLRDRFQIIGNDKELIKKKLSNIGRIPGDIGKVRSIIRNVWVKEIYQGIIN
jgi:hypothetical protein